MKKSTIILLISLVLIGLFLGEINEVTGESIWSRFRRIRKVPAITQREISLEASEYSLRVGETKLIEDKKVTLVNVGSSGAVIVDVNGNIKTISSTETKNIEGLSIKIVEAHFASVKTQRSAVLKIVKTTEEILNKYSFRVGETKLIEDRKVTLVNVGSAGAVNIDVNGNIQTIQNTETKIIEGLSISIIDAHFASIKSQRSADLKIVKVTTEIQPSPPSTTQVTYQGILDMLNKCDNIGSIPTVGKTCDTLCKGHGMCIFSHIIYKNSDGTTAVRSGVGMCDDDIKQSMMDRSGVSISCTCCKL